EEMLRAPRLLGEAGLPKRADRALVRAVAPRADLVEVQDPKRVVHDERDRLGGVAVSPGRLLADHERELGRAVHPVDGTEPHVADVTSVVTADDREEHVRAAGAAL